MITDLVVLLVITPVSYSKYLSSMSHSIKGEEIILSDVKLVSEVLKPRLITKYSLLNEQWVGIANMTS